MMNQNNLIIQWKDNIIAAAITTVIVAILIIQLSAIITIYLFLLLLSGLICFTFLCITDIVVYWLNKLKNKLKIK